MQNYIKLDTDTRTFQEIWNSLSSAEQSNLRTELQAKLGVSRQAIYSWHKKGTHPISGQFRKAVCNVLNKTLVIKSHPVTLFPNAK